MHRLNYKNARKVTWALCGVGFLLIIIGIASDMLTEFGIFGMLTMSAGGVVLFAFWRCPNCNGSLPSSVGKANYCPYCGEKLK